MTHQEFVDMIAAVAVAVNPNGHYSYGRKEDNSLDFGEEWPQIHMVRPRAEEDRVNDNITWSAYLFFIGQDAQASSKDEREAVYSAMYDLSVQFTDMLENSFDVQVLTSVLKTPEERQFMATATGYGIAIRVISKMGCPVVTDLCPVGIVTINDDKYAELSSGGVLNVPVQYENGTPVGNIVEGVVLIPNPAVCDTATAELYDTNGTLLSTTVIDCSTTEPIEAPDGTVVANNSLGVTLGTSVVRSGGSSQINTPDINFTNSNGIITHVPAGEDIIADQCVPIPAGVPLVQNGQGGFDDGDLININTLPADNVFGNTSRFTDLSGSQSYPDDIVLDHSTDNGISIVGVYRILISPQSNWGAITSGAASFSHAGFSTGWLPAGDGLIFRLRRPVNALSTVFNFAPLNISTTGNLWSATAYKNLPGSFAYKLDMGSGQHFADAMSNNGYGLYYRHFTYAELGL